MSNDYFQQKYQEIKDIDKSNLIDIIKNFEEDESTDITNKRKVSSNIVTATKKLSQTSLENDKNYLAQRKRYKIIDTADFRKKLFQNEKIIKPTGNAPGTYTKI